METLGINTPEQHRLPETTDSHLQVDEEHVLDLSDIK